MTDRILTARATNTARRMQSSAKQVPREAFEWLGRDPHVEEYPGWSLSSDDTLLESYKQATWPTERMTPEPETQYKQGLGHIDESMGRLGDWFTTTVLRTSWHPEEQTTFDGLAEVWRRETAHLASPRARVLHFAYQQIIGLGSVAIPMLLRELRDRPDDWFWALAAIAREDPASGVVDPDDARSRWLTWGASNGFLW